MNYSTARRLDFIDWRLTVHGSIRREHLQTTFGISQAQASADLAAFEAEHPGAMRYDKSARTLAYVPAKTPYRSRRNWSPAALKAMEQLTTAGHPMAWGG